MSRLQQAIEQIEFSRKYTLWLLEATPDSDWFRTHEGGITHIGWQAGHISFAQYRLALWRIRGAQPDDDTLLTPEFRAPCTARNSVPVLDASKNLSPPDIRNVMNRIHATVLVELPRLTEADLDAPVPHPHPYATTKLKAMLWCSQHELVHAGQIGLLRRQLGHSSLW